MLWKGFCILLFVRGTVQLWLVDCLYLVCVACNFGWLYQNWWRSLVWGYCTSAVELSRMKTCSWWVCITSISHTPLHPSLLTPNRITKGKAQRRRRSLPWDPRAGHRGRAQSCTRAASGWTLGAVSVPWGCSGTAMGFRASWWVPVPSSVQGVSG